MRDRLEAIERDILLALDRLEGCPDEYDPLRKLLIKSAYAVDMLLNPKVYDGSPAGSFDRAAYQREYMRKHRAAQKAKPACNTPR